MIEAGMFVGIGLVLVAATAMMVAESRRRRDLFELQRQADDLRGLCDALPQPSRRSPDAP